MSTEIIINQIIMNTKKSVKYYLNGGCYVFAKEMKAVLGGNILYLLDDFHFVLNIGKKLYDASGNVTKKYKNSRHISEEEFLKRKRLGKEYKQF